MKDDTYNGWTNYATWRVNLEIFDGMDVEDHFDLEQEPYDLGIDLKCYVEEIIDSTGAHGLANDYALAFLSDVNWREIAKHLLMDHYVNNDQPIPEHIYQD